MCIIQKFSYVRLDTLFWDSKYQFFPKVQKAYILFNCQLLKSFINFLFDFTIQRTPCISLRWTSSCFLSPPHLSSFYISHPLVANRRHNQLSTNLTVKRHSINRYRRRIPRIVSKHRKPLKPAETSTKPLVRVSREPMAVVDDFRSPKLS